LAAGLVGVVLDEDEALGGGVASDVDEGVALDADAARVDAVAWAVGTSEDRCISLD